MVVIKTENQPIVFSGQEVIYGSNVATPQPAEKLIIRSSADIPITYSGQEVIQ